MASSVFFTIILMAFSTYLTRILGFLVLRNRKLSRTTEKVMEAVPGCVLISVIAPTIMSGDIANTIAVILTCLAMMKFSLFPTVIISIAATGLLRTIF
ncbi:AzlD family protein [Actinobacillus equuli]|uniref:Predicted membrane protein n=1 Tax=Actinobacillus equuli TaxID=718 RepID=A0AAX3FP18_ACTEU|nr:AzlD family protein [Actinobacillus equuli]WGE44549.1 AzlD family protein [Actinobacillus equuli subsp. equuli]WGE57261.1 AzlD family protein [Actinobacillus equuli subsp. equuli]VEE91995.1 Predicted membrane protein [Actinobacillus equuli]